jgi:hypothetical protein
MKRVIRLYVILGGKDHPQQGLMQNIVEGKKLFYLLQDRAHFRMVNGFCLETRIGNDGNSALKT